MTVNKWQMGAPPVGVVCVVWHETEIYDATFDGTVWRAAVTGRVLDGVTHWMVKAEKVQEKIDGAS